MCRKVCKIARSNPDYLYINWNSTNNDFETNHPNTNTTLHKSKIKINEGALVILKCIKPHDVSSNQACFDVYRVTRSQFDSHCTDTSGNGNLSNDIINKVPFCGKGNFPVATGYISMVISRSLMHTGMDRSIYLISNCDTGCVKYEIRISLAWSRMLSTLFIFILVITILSLFLIFLLLIGRLDELNLKIHRQRKRVDSKEFVMY